jgi:hypothetical protein
MQLRIDKLVYNAQQSKLKLELGADYPLLHDYVMLREILLWHYRHVLQNLYGNYQDPTDAWPVLLSEHIVTTKRQMRQVVAEWLETHWDRVSDYKAITPYRRDTKCCRLLNNAFAWERKRQQAHEGSMQEQGGDKEPSLLVPGLLSKRDNVNTFIPCTRKKGGSVTWNKGAWRL